MMEDAHDTPQVGDVITLEAKTMALVGNILEISENEIIIEGGVYQFDESDTQDQSSTLDLTRMKELAGLKESELEQYQPLIRALKERGYKRTWETTTGSYWQKKGLNFRIELGLLKNSLQIIVYPMGSNTPFLQSALVFGSKMQHMLQGTSKQAYSLDRALSTLDKLEHSYIEVGMGANIVDEDTTNSTDTNFNEAEYQGRQVQLGKPMRGDVRKYKVYVKDPKTGNIKKVNFGDPNMEIKRDDPKRRANFRARHGCGTPRSSDRTKAAYWSCRMWSSKPVSQILKK